MHRRKLSSSRAYILAIIFGVVLPCGTQSGWAQGGPAPPVSPKSEQECESWKDEYHAYLKQLEASYWQCERNDSTPVGNWVPGFSCITVVQVNVPPQCAAISSQWDCENKRFGPMLNACFAAARQAKDAAKENDPSRDLLSKTASGVPDVAATNAMRMADLLADQGKASASKAAVQSAIKAYNTTDFINNLYKVYDPSQPPAQRLAAITGFMSNAAIGKNPLAEDMLKTALTGLVDTNQTALDGLLRDLDAFSAQIGQDNAAALRHAIEEAKAEEARRVNERRSAEEAAKRRAAHERQLAEERAKAAEEAEQQRQEKLRAAQRQREMVRSEPPPRPSCASVAGLESCLRAGCNFDYDWWPIHHTNSPRCIAFCKNEYC